VKGFVNIGQKVEAECEPDNLSFVNCVLRDGTEVVSKGLDFLAFRIQNGRCSYSSFKTRAITVN
jgi:hypothetical protein